MSLTQAVSQNYIMQVKNDSDRELAIETVWVEYKDIPLSKPAKPKPDDDWKMTKHSGKTLRWAPQPDPVTQLRYSSVAPPPGVAISITFVVVCRIEGKMKTVKGRQTVTVDFGNRSMTPFGP